MVQVEDRSRRSNVRLVGLKEDSEELDATGFLISNLLRWISSLGDWATRIERAHTGFTVTRTRMLTALAPWSSNCWIAPTIRQFWKEPEHSPFSMTDRACCFFQTTTGSQREKGRISTKIHKKMTSFGLQIFLLYSAQLKFIAEMHSLIAQFIWKGKHARVKLTTLERTKLIWGLAVPNLYFYYCAFQIKSGIWGPSASIEAARVMPHHLEDSLYTATGCRNISLQFGSIITNSIKVWKKTEKMMGSTCSLYWTSPLWNN